jgi:hypothetical protein
VLVLGDLVPEEEATSEAFEADGTRHTLDLAACILNLEPASDWLLRMDDERCYLTDAVLGESWGTDATLPKARECTLGLRNHIINLRILVTTNQAQSRS